MCFEVFGADKISQFNIQMGEELTVSFDIDARQWRDRWFNSFRAWAVNRVAQQQPAAAMGAAAAGVAQAPFPPAQNAAVGDDPFASDSAAGDTSADDLPF